MEEEGAEEGEHGPYRMAIEGLEEDSEGENNEEEVQWRVLEIKKQKITAKKHFDEDTERCGKSERQKVGEKE